MKTSEQINELAVALAKAQGAIEGAAKGKENPHFRSKYADLSSVWEACRAALACNGLSVVQMTDTSDKDEVIVDTRILHASGQWIEGRLVLPVSKTDAQGYGSALTYARRYGLAAAVGVAPEDDDGNLAAAARPARTPTEHAIAKMTNGTHAAGQVAKDAFDGMADDEKTFLREYAMEVIGLYGEGKDGAEKRVCEHLAAHPLDGEEKLAVWSLLPPPVRSAIKKGQSTRDLATQP